MKTLFSLLFFSSFIFLSGQVNTFLEEESEQKMTELQRIDLHKADKLITEKLYLEAGTYLDTLYKAYPADKYLSFLAGLCISYDPNKSGQALVLLIKADSIKSKLPDYEYHLAYAYEQNDKFVEAAKLYESYLKNKLPADVKSDVKHRLDYCKNSKDLAKKIAVVKIMNIGKPVNSTASEYVPCLPSDESFIVFTYLGEKSKGGKQTITKVIDKVTGKPKIDAIYFEDVFISKKDANGNWLPPYGIESINTVNHDASVSISHDGSKLFLFRNIGAGKGDIYQSNLVGETWSTPQKLKGINSAEWEGSATLTPDEKHIIFSSERKDGLGARDLWVAEVLADGSWGNVKNMGEKINTKYDEDSPFVTADGMVLFFSSNNNKSIGGYDIFRSDKVGGEWTVPYNVGKPVNTPQDDRFYVVSADGKRGYYSSGKAGGFGLQDIYIVEPGMIGKPLALVQAIGKVTIDSLPTEAEIHVRSKVAKKEVFAVTYSNVVTGKFLVNLPAGDDYELIFKFKNFPEQIKEVNTTFVDSFIQMEVFADFYSEKKIAEVKVDTSQVKADVENEFFDFKSFISKYGNSKLDSLDFKVQIGAYRFIENFNYTSLIGMPKVIRKTYDDGITRFTVGDFKTFNEAAVLLDPVKAKVVKDAFIIAIYKRKRISLESLARLGVLKN